MSQYLLSLYAVGGDPHASTSPEDMQAFIERVYALGPEIKASGTFVFTGGLDDPDAATLARSNDGDLVVTDALSRLLKP